jgi:hypothetical protein
MTDPTESELAMTILDASLGVPERLAAMASLRALNPGRAADALLPVASRETESDEILRGAGTELARATEAGASVTEFDMRNMAGVAYEAFCDWQP